MSSNPIPSVEEARAALLAIAPTFVRGTIPLDGTGQPQLPAEVLVLDVISAPVVNDFDDEIAEVTLQVTAGAERLKQASDLITTAEAVMKGLGWKLVAYRTLPADGAFRQVAADFTRLQ